MSADLTAGERCVSHGAAWHGMHGMAWEHAALSPSGLGLLPAQWDNGDHCPQSAAAAVAVAMQRLSCIMSHKQQLQSVAELSCCRR